MPLNVKQPMLCHVIVIPLLLALALSSCGKIGDPIPPDIFFPQSITDLTAQVEKRAVVLRWSMKDRSGTTARIRILRNERDTNGECPGCYREYTQLVDTPLNDARFRQPEKDVFYYHDGEVRSGYSYSYLIVACDALNYCSEKSNMAETDFQEKD